MTKIRRGGYVFAKWVGDHSPTHVHVFRDGKLIGKWNLDDACVLEGRLSAKAVSTIRQLQKEGRL